MARPLRIELAGGLYHVTAHGNGRLWLYRNAGNRVEFLNLLGSATLKYGVIVHGFVLMTTHIHLLVETPLPNLSQFMRQCLSDYGLYYNRCFRRRGSVFKARYQSFLIQKDDYYLMVVRYLYNNPVKARLVKCPEKYRWSSLYYLLNKRRREEVSWFNAEEVLRLVGGRQGLVELLEEEVEELPYVYRAFIGDKEWADRKVIEQSEELDEEISGEREMRKGVFDVEQVIKLVAREYGVPKNQLYSGEASDPRKVCVYVLSKYTPLPAVEIGKMFEMSKWAVFKTVQRLARQKKEMKLVKKSKKRLS